jgi:hypothetical protein
LDIRDIAEADLTSLKAQGYTEADVNLLSADEVQSLLIVIPEDEDDGRDPHAEAMQEQDNAAAPAPAAETPPAEEDPAPAPAAPPIPPPAELTEKITTLKAEERDAFKRLMDGEIESEEYLEIKDRVESEVDTLKEQAREAQRTMQDAQRDWQNAERAQMAAAKAEGLDYQGKPALLAAFNVHLRTLGADPKNERRDSAWFLAEAHKLTKADLGITTPAKNKHTSVDIGEIPPTLRGVPTAGTGAVNTDEFAHMRNLEGIALERAHAALTEAQRDRWMNS